MSDEKTIAELLAVPKRITSTRAPEKKKGHVQLSARAKSEDGVLFIVFVRLLQALHESFSVGIVHQKSKTILLRVNGDHGIHRNPNGEVIQGPHVHLHEDESEPPSGGAPTHAVPWTGRRATIDGGWQELLARANLTSLSQMDKKVRGLVVTSPPEQLKLAFDADGSPDQDPT